MCCCSDTLSSPWQHSASWWPRLFRDDPVQVAWDDYDKDYSDLPPAIAAAHAAATALQERQNAEEAAEKDRRKAVQVRWGWRAQKTTAGYSGCHPNCEQGVAFRDSASQQTKGLHIK